MNVKELMTRTPAVCSCEDSANEAARIMWERDCGAVPVIDESGRLAGIVTDRDICMAAYFQGTALSAIPLSRIMTREVCACQADDEVGTAEHMMQEHRVRRLPVVENGGTLVGILSLSDVAQGVRRTSGPRQRSGHGDDLLQTVTAVSEPRTQRHAAAS
jgi:CBS domain-containing protein